MTRGTKVGWGLEADLLWLKQGGVFGAVVGCVSCPG
jgi:hypothetical protein